MKKHLILPVFILIVSSVNAQTKGKSTTTTTKTGTTTTAAKPLKNNADSLSYAFGISLGQYLKSQNVTTFNYIMLNKAIADVLKERKPLLDLNEANMLMGKLSEKQAQKTVGVEKAKGKKFLTENRTKAGVKETASGLQYEIITAGTGPMPKLTDTISAHYRGTLLDGKEFDNSYKRGQPLQIAVAGVIPGWTEALQLMPVGSKWKLYLPSEIAYGDYGAGQDIPGGATLVFEIELLGIVNKPAQQ